MPEGFLLCRLNSIRDINYGAEGSPELAAGLYRVENQPKRFFSESDINELFGPNWKLGDLVEKTIDRYKKLKTVWEFAAINV